MIAIDICMPIDCSACPLAQFSLDDDGYCWCNGLEKKVDVDNCNGRPNECPLKEVELVRVKKIMDARDQELFFNNNAGHMDRYVRCEIERDALRDVHDEGLIRITKQRADQDVYFPGAIEYRGEMLIVKPDPVLRDGLMPE